MAVRHGKAREVDSAVSLGPLPPSNPDGTFGPLGQVPSLLMEPCVGGGVHLGGSLELHANTHGVTKAFLCCDETFSLFILYRTQLLKGGGGGV